MYRKPKHNKTTRKPRYEEAHFLGRFNGVIWIDESFDERSRSKSHSRRGSLEKSHRSKDRASSQHKPKQGKETLFQVDINMDSK